ncbi:MAG: hypothetical protein ABI619_04875 [Betaproteobacteria bacterium]
MKIESNGSLVGPRTPAFSMALDVVRIVMTAVVAAIGFALLLALSVLSLTVIAPPAQASGAPAVTMTESNPSAGIDSEKLAKVDAVPIQLAAAPTAAQAKPSDPRLDSTHKRVLESQHKPDTPVVLYLVLALVAGCLAFFVYSLARRQS